MNNYQNNLIRDLALVVFSVLIAVILAKTGALQELITSTKEMRLIGSFIAGIFFTSIFTTAPAIVALGEIAHANSVILTALLGGMGALAGDLVIYKFVRDRLSEHLGELIKHQDGGKRLGMLFKLKYFRWLTFFVGGFIIASPLPDELGVSLLGLSKMRIRFFIVLSFVFNFVGILLIGLVAKTL
ncbi:MAG: hypothetical protein A3I26_03780 [Candidatus Yanofskybacteria bacterium RIFCSPLOWO2_02_FULL_43_10]|uniref:TVP38/TMEM64 family membrane protein n=1 Tax=Candidatus Yanofskybacteria bacterium RIFCSPLOWO2_12_FULL_43_11b TaxID=1802710 RepID=A0A1F8HA10_9BACT|nr:MAG: hypothetical protein A2742_00480 [Candidatus Yanofskybacteria bacterium RIFCSPHIGHO2_01_FULL_43_32]OGN11242.1 MAG: hypothetical protein A3C69_00615 [Candidatus Yanofskybacteria bacterium RIFCSPHIGHO2_02_FULL_43_12]OGN17878.1 MAG: hypothetical protein A3E34_00370 [Candidatus Yanofskybacteria bacterium RIFCSPHIGHO2_12_FULL_43_11]OGN24162.1 MAG: hypothetical protein A2923_02420 [Candidatus Yanofskybacteria bacterium RIFCSPLOWO2_01_FULL_43_46]OGN29661.1 MAG: hypothetical protein A3I26_03780